MPLILSQEGLKELVSHALSCPNQECCGYLLGTIQQEAKYFKRCFKMRNIHQDPKHFFAFDCKEQLQVFHSLGDLKILGVYHSHPNSWARLSQEDQKFIFFEKQSNVIISLKNGIQIASFIKKAGKIYEEKVLIQKLF